MVAGFSEFQPTVASCLSALFQQGFGVFAGGVALAAEHAGQFGDAFCFIFSPTMLAVSPPTLASTSSKTSTGISSSAARTVLSASITRAISPDEAMARNDLAGSPGLGAN